ncbi:MAG: hypothetical protein HOW73_41255 [Polyangiaceae bacterium]|nr:hypothetical protein [Polyangiaceae bacterium]
MTTRMLALSFAMVLAGCGPTVEGICNALEECGPNDCGAETCPPVGGDCEPDGEDLEELARENECDDEMDAYMECLDFAGCGWRAQCGVQRDRIDECVGGLPE